LKTAVIVIDVQSALFDQVPRPEAADAVIARINALTGRARQAGLPVAFIQHQSPNVPVQFDTAGWRFAHNLHIEPGDTVIAKTTPDSFLRTNLGEWLEGNEIKQVVICGGMTEFCVDTTTRRAAALGYQVVLASDAHTTHDKAHASAAFIRAHHNATLPDIGSFGPVISAIESAAIAF